MKVTTALGFLVTFAVLVLSLELRSIQATATGTIIQSILPEKSAKEIKNDVKVFLTKAKLRKVPLAKKRSERQLTQLYRDQRVLTEEVDNLKQDLLRIKNNSLRTALKVIEIKRNKVSKDAQEPKDKESRVQVSALTSKKVTEMEQELEEKQRKLDAVNQKIVEAQNIIKSPEDYVSVPSDYGKNPKEQREYERSILAEDRENMLYRYEIVFGKEKKPYWITDSW